MSSEALRSGGARKGKACRTKLTEPHRVLSPVRGSASFYGVVKMAFVLSIAMLPRESERRRNERPAAGEQHAGQPSCAGFWTTESILIFEIASSFAGWKQERGS